VEGWLLNQCVMVWCGDCVGSDVSERIAGNEEGRVTGQGCQSAQQDC